MTPTPSLPPLLITAGSVLFGSMVGSFLNVCIYRLPRGLSVCSPARSYCPHCSKTIPWWENVPILSWLLLRGRCSRCKEAIHVRYLLVEILTALLFGAAAAFLPLVSPLLLLPIFTLLGILIVATFVDMEHMIIPDEITWGGVAAGALFAVLLPALHHATSALGGLWLSLLGAAVGYGVLWAVVELGRLVFGKKRTVFHEPTRVLWRRNGDEADLTIGADQTPWGDFFVRGTEQIRMGVRGIAIDGRAVPGTGILWTLNHMRISTPAGVGEKAVELDRVNEITLRAQWMLSPREVMGFGDVKFLAAIGAFLGWEATVFTVAAASCLGTGYGLVTLLMGKRKWPPLPFAPYLTGGAIAWIIDGPRIVEAYLQLLLPER